MFGIQIAANKNKPILSESIFGEGLLFLLLFTHFRLVQTPKTLNFYKQTGKQWHFGLILLRL